MKKLPLCALFGALAAAASGTYAMPTYLPVGAQTGVDLATITNGGWTQCYAATMATAIGDSGQNVLDRCSGDYLMMAGRETGAATFLALAAALRPDTIFDTGHTANTHLANGTEWRFSPNWGWGFTEEGDTLSNTQCDISASPLSMCLHTFNFAGGYRINDIQGLNNDVNYEKVFFVADAVGLDNNGNRVPEPGSLALASFALAGLAAVRRYKAH